MFADSTTSAHELGLAADAIAAEISHPDIARVSVESLFDRGVDPSTGPDPLWEALCFTIIFGLLSSTFLVLFSFPCFYLGIEAIRDKIKTPWRHS